VIVKNKKKVEKAKPKIGLKRKEDEKVEVVI